MTTFESLVTKGQHYILAKYKMVNLNTAIHSFYDLLEVKIVHFKGEKDFKLQTLQTLRLAVLAVAHDILKSRNLIGEEEIMRILIYRFYHCDGIGRS